MVEVAKRAGHEIHFDWAELPLPVASPDFFPERTVQDFVSVSVADAMNLPRLVKPLQNDFCGSAPHRSVLLLNSESLARSPVDEYTPGEPQDVEALKKAVLLSTWAEDGPGGASNTASQLPLSLRLPEPEETAATFAMAEKAGDALLALCEQRLAPLRSFKATPAVELKARAPSRVSNGLSRQLEVSRSAAEAVRAWKEEWLLASGSSSELDMERRCFTEAPTERCEMAALLLPIDLPLEPIGSAGAISQGDSQALKALAAAVTSASAEAAATAAATGSLRNNFGAGTRAPVADLAAFRPRGPRPVSLLRPSSGSEAGLQGGSLWGLGAGLGEVGKLRDASEEPFSGGNPLPPFIVLSRRPGIKGVSPRGAGTGTSHPSAEAATADLARALLAATKGSSKEEISATFADAIRAPLPSPIKPPHRQSVSAHRLWLGPGTVGNPPVPPLGFPDTATEDVADGLEVPESSILRDNQVITFDMDAPPAGFSLAKEAETPLSPEDFTLAATLVPPTRPRKGDAPLLFAAPQLLPENAVTQEGGDDGRLAVDGAIRDDSSADLKMVAARVVSKEDGDNSIAEKEHSCDTSTHCSVPSGAAAVLDEASTTSSEPSPGRKRLQNGALKATTAMSRSDAGSSSSHCDGGVRSSSLSGNAGAAMFSDVDLLEGENCASSPVSSCLHLSPLNSAFSSRPL